MGVLAGSVDAERLTHVCGLAINASEHANATYIATFDPPTVLSLLSRLSTAADRERVLVEALRPFAEAACHLHPSQPDDGLTLDGITAGEWRAAARALTQEPTR
jgi:hypothetical protein